MCDLTTKACAFARAHTHTPCTHRCTHSHAPGMAGCFCGSSAVSLLGLMGSSAGSGRPRGASLGAGAGAGDTAAADVGEVAGPVQGCMGGTQLLLVLCFPLVVHVV